MGRAKTPKGKASPSTTKRKATHNKPSHSSVNTDAPKDLAAKKKNVRDLAKAGNWEKIKRLYGDKMVAKAKAYIEKNGANDVVPAVEIPRATSIEDPPQVAVQTEKMTPQLLAKQILAMNGYNTKGEVRIENATEEPTISIPRRPVMPRSKPKSHNPRVAAPIRNVAMANDSGCADECKEKQPSLSARQTNPSYLRAKPATHNLSTPVCSEPAETGSKQVPVVICDSPGELTEEQRRRIEERRRQALEKRKRVAPIPLAAPETPALRRHYAITPAAKTGQQTKPAFAMTREGPTRVASLGSSPQSLGGYLVVRKTDDRSPFRIICADESMLQELEIAAQITDWDIDEPGTHSHPRLVTPPSRSARDAHHHTKQDTSWRESPATKSMRTRKHVESSTNPSVIRLPDKTDACGQGQSHLSDKPITTLSQELAIAAEIPWWDFENDLPEEQTLTNFGQLVETRSNKRPYNEGQPPSARIENSKHHVSHDPNQKSEAQNKSSRGATSNREPTKELDSFIAKHFLDDKLDEAVLNFVNMMLA